MDSLACPAAALAVGTQGDEGGLGSRPDDDAWLAADDHGGGAGAVPGVVHPPPALRQGVGGVVVVVQQVPVPGGVHPRAELGVRGNPGVRLGDHDTLAAFRRPVP